MSASTHLISHLVILAAAAAAIPTRPVYKAQRLPAGGLTIDGDLSKSVWSRAPWSEPFQDIRGEADAPAESQPGDGSLTRFKMLWDDEYLYIAAELHYPSDRLCVATFTQRNSPIYQRDSDFEVFVDAEGSGSYYKELEVNALNCVWNLMIDRPYSIGGSEYSGRVARPGERTFYDAHRQRTATRLVRGSLNKPPDSEAGETVWTVEIALAHDDTLLRQPGAHMPARGRRWRINFSRVEEEGALNWVWSPQVVWEPRERRYQGKVDMHLPDAWGSVLFDDDSDGSGGDFGPGGGGGEATPEAEARAEKAQKEETVAVNAAMMMFYAQQVYAETHDGTYARSYDELRDAQLIDEEAVASCHLLIEPTSGGGRTGVGYVATAMHLSGVAASVDERRRLVY